MTRGAIRAKFRGFAGRFELNAAFETPARGVTALFGHSGCGKTMLLRCIAGLNRLDDGFIAIDGETWQDDGYFRPTHQRPIGYVFQEASLFPHLSVRRNLTYGAPRKPNNGESLRFDDVVDLLGLAGLLDRAPSHLSGGERQRVAIGRALLSQPRLMLMDEPLSALDRMTKDEILPFLERLHEELSMPVIYVSHDMEEVERLADRLVLMKGGRVVASGPLARLQSDPDLPLMQSRSAAVSLNAKVERYDANYGVASLRADGGSFEVPSPPVAAGEIRRIRILATDVSLARELLPRSTILNVLPARILSVAPSEENRMTAVLGLGPEGAGARILARVTRLSWERLEFAPRMDVFAQIKAVTFAPGRTGSANGGG
ncbi:molybdenum ABC transporter ATP-binding protein [Methylocystis heyeri]|uniref:Molybdenum ABC transporter ATP-binding protein n=1 Tax=Methylocystis heyeri TaxID=391905 RepID=A0A6B8K9B6_9HYPH|nr:molybdenum ABC transporter ATP-binding protein [Methylocystis heyeri]QGM44686.1 molybdenum ABC transporter ATP-binding protein [Methylocystis heyeri]